MNLFTYLGIFKICDISDVVVYHNSSNFKNIKTLQCINDPTKPIDTYRISPIISNSKIN